jgi:hypothetical protein
MTSLPSRSRSTADPARPSRSELPPKPSMNTYAPCNKAVLQRPLEAGQYTSCMFGRRLRGAGLLGSMGSIGDEFDNVVAESFFHTLQVELSLNTTGTPATNSPTRSSSGSSVGTGRTADTPTPTCSAPSTTRPQPQHDHNTRPDALDRRKLMMTRRLHHRDVAI